MSIQQLLEAGQLDATTDTKVLLELVQLLDYELLELRQRKWSKGDSEQAMITHRQTMMDTALAMLTARYGSDGMTLVDKGKTDFKVLVISGYQVLLERIEEEEGWQVIVSVFIDSALRYDEWEDCPSIEAAWQVIDSYSLDQAQAFIDRANKWSQQQMAKRASPFMPQSLN